MKQVKNSDIDTFISTQ